MNHNFVYQSPTTMHASLKIFIRCEKMDNFYDAINKLTCIVASTLLWAHARRARRTFLQDGLCISRFRIRRRLRWTLHLEIVFYMTISLLDFGVASNSKYGTGWWCYGVVSTSKCAGEIISYLFYLFIIIDVKKKKERTKSIGSKTSYGFKWDIYDDSQS